MVSSVISLVGRRILPLALVMLLQTGPDVVENTATVHFPASIDFHLEATGDSPITSTEIEVRTDALACGSGATRAAPDQFTPGKSISADWTWELRQTGALPPGTTVTWQWSLTGEGGQTITTPEQHVTLEDDTHDWQTLEDDTLHLHWYEGDQDFARSLQGAAGDGIRRLNDTLDVSDDRQIQIYIYASSADMQSATLYAPSWSGGLAFSAENTLLLAVDPASLTWGKRAIAHELTHVIVGRRTYSCANSTPTWFEEGLAMYFEGPPDPTYTAILDDAVKADTLLSVRELSAILSGDPTLAGLSYAESASLVSFLIDRYGKDKLLLLLDQWKQGVSQDRALTAVYGFDRDGLEAAWRESINAQPMKQQPAASGSDATPYPTLVPLDGPPLAQTEVIPTPAYLAAAPAAAPTPLKSAPSLPNLLPGWVIGVGCGGLALLAILLAAGVLLVRRSRRGAPTDLS